MNSYPCVYMRGDANGVVVIKQDDFEQVIQRAKNKYESDQEKISAILNN